MPIPSKTPNLISARPRIAVLLGDPGGIGPEMAVKLLARQRNLDAARVLLIADPVVLAAGERAAGMKLDPLRVEGFDDLRFEDGRPTLLPRDWMQGREPVLGESNAASGRASLGGMRPSLRCLPVCPVLAAFRVTMVRTTPRCWAAPLRRAFR